MTDDEKPDPRSLYTPEVLREMRDAGMDKPDDIDWPTWLWSGEPKERHELVITLAAQGIARKIITELTGYSAPWLSQILSHPSTKESVRRRQIELFGKDVRDRLKTLSQPAIDVMEGILNNPQERSNLRLDAAKYVVDQVAGKAEQKIHHEGNSYIEFIAKVEELKKVRSVLPLEPELDNPRKALDNFIEQEVPTYKVGVKGGTEES